MASRDDLMTLQQIIDYEFNNEGLGITALTAADRSDEGGISDGNRRLAQVGSMVLELMSCNTSWNEDDDRAQANQKLCSRVNCHNLASIATSSGIYKLMKFSPRQQQPLPDKVLSKAVQAVAGAVWCDSDCDFQRVTQAILQLQNYDCVHHQQSNTSKPVNKQAEQTIDPAVLRVGQNQAESSQTPRPIASMALEVIDTDTDLLNSCETNTCYGYNELESSNQHDYTVDWGLCSNLPLEGRMSHPEILMMPTELPQFAELPHTKDFENLLASSSGAAGEVRINDQFALRRSMNAKPSLSRPSRVSKPPQKSKRNLRDMTKGSERIEELIQNETAKWHRFDNLGEASVNFSYSVESLKRHASERLASDGSNFLVLSFLMLVSSTSVLSLKEVLRSHRNSSEEQSFDHSRRQDPMTRLNTINSLSGDIARNVLLRRYHTLQLYIDCLDPYSAGAQEGFIVNSFGNTSSAESSEKGNPLHLAKRRTTNAMIRTIFPQSTDENRSEQEKRVKLLQRLGESLFALTSGGSQLGILALLPTEVSVLGIEPSLNLSDASLMEASVAEIQMLVNRLEQSTKYFSQFVAIGKEVLDLILHMSSHGGKQFLFENTNSKDIEARPADSIYLLHFLQQA